MERRSRAILQRADDGGAWLMVKLDHMRQIRHLVYYLLGQLDCVK